MLTVVSEGLCGEDLPQRHRVGVLDLLPHVHQHHALGVNQAETWAEKSWEEHSHVRNNTEACRELK